MEKSKMNSNGLGKPDEYIFYQRDREVDIKKCLSMLWEGKWIILFTTIFCVLITSLLVTNKISTYTSVAKLLVNKKSSYGIVVNNTRENIYGERIVGFISEKSNIEVKNLRSVNFSIDRNGVVTISQTSSDKEAVYKNVSAFVDNYNDALKYNELIPLEIAIDSIESLLSDQGEQLTREPLALRLSHQIYKKEILKDPRSELATVLKKARPASIIKPSNKFSMFLSGLLGFALGCALVTIRFFFFGKKTNK